jgi:hypothetical protein
MSEFIGKKLTLKEPIHLGSQLISELEIRKPKAKDIRPCPTDMQTRDILDLAGRLCAQPPAVIDELSMEDTIALLDIVSNFIKPGPETGLKA